MSSLHLWYSEPASAWTEALPLGNGSLGAMVFGGTTSERIQLNEETLWAGGPYVPASPAALAALPEARRRIFAGDYAGAHELIGREMMGRPHKQMPYQTAGDLWIDLELPGEQTDFRRELDLDCAVATTTFRHGDVGVRREAFCSHPAGVLVVRMKADCPGALSGSLRLTTPHESTTASVAGMGLRLRGRNGAAHGVPGALRFTIALDVHIERGRMEVAGDTLRFVGCDGITVLLTAATSYRRYDDVSGDPDATIETRLAAAGVQSFDALLASHLEDHRALFRRMALDLGEGEGSELETDERVKKFAATGDPALVALFFHYSRYLMIACSRVGGQPATLQGIWCDSLRPPWDSKYTININAEMNYWLAERANLAECHEPLLRLITEIAETGARTALANWGASGWVCHHNTDLWRATAPVDGPTWGFWPMGGAWLCRHLWEHYAYGGDRDFLARVWPVMRGAAEFFLDSLVRDPRTGWLVTCPSLSPENTHPGGVSVCAGPTMDCQILRDLFDRCLDAIAVLGGEEHFAARLSAVRAQLPPLQVGAEGQLQEWLEDWDLDAPEPHHRHVSHLFALHPGDQITPDATPDLAAAARRSLELRGDEGTGWSLAWKINFWARLGDGERAYALLKRLMVPAPLENEGQQGGLYPNLFDAHPPFQIDGNFGAPAGVLEMLVQVHDGVVHLLPALPPAWRAGEVRGLRLPGNLEMDFAWHDHRLTSARLRPHCSGELMVRSGTLQRLLSLIPGVDQRLDSGLNDAL